MINDLIGCECSFAFVPYYPVWSRKWAQTFPEIWWSLRFWEESYFVTPLSVRCVSIQQIKVITVLASQYTMCLSVSRPSCAAPAATHETRRPCSPSVSTFSATNVWRCVTIRDRGSAPSATVPSEPTTFTASTLPRTHRDGGENGRRENCRENQRRGKSRETEKELKIYLKTFWGYKMSVFPHFSLSLERLVLLHHWHQLVINLVTKQWLRVLCCS